MCCHLCRRDKTSCSRPQEGSRARAVSCKVLLAPAALVAAIAPFLTGITNAQSSKGFEVASIRLADSTRPSLGAQVELGNGRFDGATNVYNYITGAFRLPPCPNAYLWVGDDCPFVTGGPAWVRRDTYEIRATLPEGTPAYSRENYFQGRAPAISSMLEDLVRDRFQLKLHHEMRELEVFLLTVVQGGPKVTRADPNVLIQWPDGTMRPPRTFGFSRAAAPNGQPLLRLSARNRSMHDATEALTNIMGRPVIDRSNLEGNFDWELNYPPGLGANANGRAIDEFIGPEFFSAIEKQAGLKLQSAREKIDVIVIDSIQRPSEN